MTPDQIRTLFNSLPDASVLAFKDAIEESWIEANPCAPCGGTGGFVGRSSDPFEEDWWDECPTCAGTGGEGFPWQTTGCT